MTQPTSATHHSGAAHQRPAKKAVRSTKKLSRLILWEWGIVLALLSGLGVTILVISQGPDPKSETEALVARMRAAAVGRLSVSVDKVSPKVCVLASWELSRSGVISVNGLTPPRISAAILVDLCNQEEMATLTWVPKTGN